MYLKLVFLYLFLILILATVFYTIAQFHIILPQLLSTIEAAVLRVQYMRQQIPALWK